MCILAFIFMYISINGHLGSGKSEIARLLQKNDGFEIFSTGAIQRKIAVDLGISTLELNERSLNDFSYDYLIDEELKKHAAANVGKNVIFDSRMAWFFVPDSFKIHLVVAPAIAAKRVFNNRVSVAEKYSSEHEAMFELLERRRVEDERYFKVYNARMSDYSNYDLILDTSHIDLLAVYNIILKCMRDKEGGNRVIVSTQNIYPAKNVLPLNTDTVNKYVQQLKAGTELAPVDLIKHRDSLYIYDGYHRVAACNTLGGKTISAIIAYQDGDLMPNNVALGDYISTVKEDLHAWEKANGFKFGFYLTPNL